MSIYQTRRRDSGFTLIELLVVISIIALLIGILLPALGAARKAAQASQCLSSIRSIGQGFALFATDHKNYVFPTTQMYSGTKYYVTLTNLNYIDEDSEIHRCPNDASVFWDDNTRTTSYAMNGYFAPNHDPYGIPMRDESGIRLEDVADPSEKITVVEIAEDRIVDHVMPMYWGTSGPVHPLGGMGAMARNGQLDSSSGNVPKSVIRERHADASNYAFADGHGAATKFSETWDDTIADMSDRDTNDKTDKYDPKYDN